ncbi:MAG: bifunctional adenosylcobinamide kinase/adenosylcobinamide-phosphate guanylyltransferase [Thermoleophilia bacterium]|nr:bifunctional adenosylcobinamide kinase/adenosylcobinamide-phosphate guanylyltransferase [Thermoleophilia bacterium]
MGQIVLVTGGGRSGKSAYAQRLAETLPGPRLFVATAVPFDEELKTRVARHRESRAEQGWTTKEEPLALAQAIKAATGFSVILVDCLTFWINNLMWETANYPSEDQVAALCRELVSVCQGHDATCILVTNEVGFGLVPTNTAARVYRDLLGRCNQVVAAAADAVVLLVCGLPLPLKGAESLAALGVFPMSGPGLSEEP